MATGGGAWIVLRGVSRTFRQGRTEVRAVDAVSLDIESGETVALMGPSGAGKSTLLHLIGGLDQPDQGRVIVNGIDVHALTRRTAARYRRIVGFVFQYYRLLPHLSVEDNVLAPLLTGRIRERDVDRAHDLINRVGLASQLRVAAAELSGGEQQRVAIARALIARPRMIIADEPTGALDSRTGEDVLDLLTSLQELWGFTLVLATHDPSVAAQCGRQLRLLDGMFVGDHRLRLPDGDDMLRTVTGLG